MTSDEYRYFVSVYDCRSFSRAARKMNISSQGIGKSIRGLEAQLGVQLFARTSQGVEPTEVATRLYPHACNILAEEERIGEVVSAARRSAETRYLIGRDSRLGDAIGAGVEEYCARHGKRIELMYSRDNEDDQARLMMEKGYDYRFLSVELDALPELIHAPLTTLHYVPVVNAQSTLAEKGTFSIDELRGRTVLTESLYHTPMRLLAKLCRSYGFELKMRAVDKTYIWELLRNPSEDVMFIRTNEAETYPWMLDCYKVLAMMPALNTQIVLQTRHDSIDPELLECIRKSLAERNFD